MILPETEEQLAKIVSMARQEGYAAGHEEREELRRERDELERQSELWKFRCGCAVELLDGKE